jgi:hypothetical protein
MVRRSCIPDGEGPGVHYINIIAMTMAGLFVIRLSLKTLKPVAKAC